MNMKRRNKNITACNDGADMKVSVSFQCLSIFVWKQFLINAILHTSALCILIECIMLQDLFIIRYCNEQ